MMYIFADYRFSYMRTCIQSSRKY